MGSLFSKDTDGRKRVKQSFINAGIYKNYACPICEDVLEEPFQHKCGHRFCKCCIFPMLAFSASPRCPTCVTVIIESHQLWPDNFVKREINQEVVGCPNCDLIGPFQQLKEMHRPHCPRNKASVLGGMLAIMKKWAMGLIKCQQQLNQG